ncbi:MAG: ferritin-like protein [Panacagrimonas sp.]|jgi:uncharacterized protein (TIGR02284 family)|nr:PA2169 family four-helix-bundle protein [Panacagrimonas sp.]MCC2656891.1 ferritin-like protein [Panacagrimonas sp.]
MDTVIKALNELIELDHDAIEAYRAAIDRLESPDFKSALTAYCADHERHTRNLSDVVRRLGGTPASGPDMKKFLTKGKVVLADLVGGDHAILTAMRMNEEVTNKAYEAALNVDMDPEARAVVASNLEDERRHRAWIQSQLDLDKREA